MTLELGDRQAAALKEWLEDYAEWLRTTANCIPDYADARDLKDATEWCRRARGIRRFLSAHWKTEYVTAPVRTKTRRTA